MRHRRLSILSALAFLGTTLPLSAQQPGMFARLVRTDGAVTLNGQPLAAGAPGTPIGDVADLQTADGRVVVALKRGGTLVLGANTAARVYANGDYDFNRVEIRSGSAVLLSASSVGLVACGTDASLSTEGIFRFDVLEPERADGSQRCRMRVYEGAASTPGASVPYTLRSGQQMILNRRAGDMIQVNPLVADAIDDFDRWAREQSVPR